MKVQGSGFRVRVVGVWVDGSGFRVRVVGVWVDGSGVLAAPVGVRSPVYWNSYAVA